MKKITSIKITNNFILITLDDLSKYKVSDDTYFELKLKANMELDEHLLNKIKVASNFHNGYLSALNKIKYKDRTEYEIREHLYNDFKLKKYEVDEIVEKLIRYDFINDIRYTTDLIERSQAKYHGYNKIKSSLISVKVNSDIIEAYLIYNYQKEFELAYEFASKSIKSIRSKNQFQSENTLRQKLMYRGFNNDIMMDVISEIDFDYDEDHEYNLIKRDFEKSFRRYKQKYEGYELRQRLYTYLRSRGYKNDVINNVLDEMENEDE